MNGSVARIREHLLLRAPQFEDLAIEIEAPIEGERLEFTLKPKKKAAATKGTRPPKDTGTGKKPPSETSKPTPEAPNNGSGTKFGLKNPFEKMGG